jgi:hypoxanthine phosphoribosyltransferase
MENIIQVHDKKFKPYLTNHEVLVSVKKVANEINRDYKNRRPLFLSILNGSFMFTADLMKEITVECELSFVKLASYQGTQSTGQVKTLIGLDMILKGHDIIILEDIIDTGKTLHEFMPVLESQNPASIEIASLLVKPEAMKYNVSVKYIGKEIPNDFIVGYGLDYDGLGRNLKDIYVITD